MTEAAECVPPTKSGASVKAQQKCLSAVGVDESTTPESLGIWQRSLIMS